MRFDRATLDARLAKLDEELATIGTIEKSIAAWRFIPNIKLDDDPGTVNARLKELWRSITLGPDLLPLSCQWWIEPEEHHRLEQIHFEEIKRTT
jgi:hypothetical protein